VKRDIPAPFVERASWPDVPAAIAELLAGRPVHYHQAIRRYLAAPAPPRPGARALDVCCGVGQGSLILRRKGWKVSAFDHSRQATDLLRAHGITFSWCAFADFAHDPLFPYQLVTCCDALEHLAHPSRVLGRVRDWLASDGRLWLCVPLEGDHRSPNPFHLNAWSRRSLLQLLTDSGWTVEREVDAPLPNQFWGVLK